MSTAHIPEPLQAHDTNRAREVLAVLLALPAVALTALAAYAGFDLATTTLVGDEAGVAQVVVIGGGLLAVVAWTGVIALHKSARRDLRAAPRRVLGLALLATFGFLVAAQLVGAASWAVPIGLGFYVLMAASAVTALVAALRM
jgi:hypothetical protein